MNDATELITIQAGTIPAGARETDGETAEFIRVRGLVQGVGFRPTVWRLARGYGLRGWVSNDGQGVTIHACGPVAAIEAFVDALPGEAPPLARIEGIERESTATLPEEEDFRIVASLAGSVHTGVVPDAATCPACVAETFNRFARRFRYPFTNCTHRGPRLAIMEAILYDRAAMREFKRRERKPFALMARYLDVVRRYCSATEVEAALLQSPAAPIVIMDASGPARDAGLGRRRMKSADLT